jgi:hypothetical protein
MIPVTTAPPTPDIIAQLNQLAVQEVKGSARFKNPTSTKRPTKRSTARRSK